MPAPETNQPPPGLNLKGTLMKESMKELIAIGASVGAHCTPCLEYHIKAAISLGVNPDEIRQAIEIGHKVEKGAMAAMVMPRAPASSSLSGYRA